MMNNDKQGDKMKNSKGVEEAMKIIDKLTMDEFMKVLLKMQEKFVDFGKNMENMQYK